MKKFKDFIKNIPKELPVLSWAGHESLRGKIKKKISIYLGLVTKPLRKNVVKEGYYKPEYNKEYHDHPDIKVNNLTADHLESIKHYSATGGTKENGHRSSYVMNNYLRQKSGDKTLPPIVGHEPSKIENGIRQLSDAFTPENTNKQKTILHGGIPDYIGKALKAAGHGSQHHLAGFTSATSEPTTALQFARQYSRKSPSVKSHYHIMEYHAEPGTALSVAPYSSYDENESIFKHGVKITYHGEKTKKDQFGNTIHTHVVTVHNEHKPLEEYGQ
jgi:hypothetical protein